MFKFFFVDEYLGSPGNSWFSDVLPIITLVLGIFLGRWLDRFDKRKRDRKAITDLITELELLKEPLGNQLARVDEFVESLNDPHKTTPKFTSVISLNLERIKGLDRPGIVDFLERRVKSRVKALELANDLFLGCDVFSHHHSQLSHIVQGYVDKCSPLFDEFEERANELLRCCARLMASIEATGNDPGQDPYVSRLLEFVDVLKGVKDLGTAKELVHEPLVEHNAQHRTDVRMNEVSELNSRILRIAALIEKEAEYAKVRIMRHRDRLNETHGKLMESVAKVRPLLNKSKP